MNSACHVYAIVHRTATLPPDLTGLNGEHLALVPWQALAAVVAVSADVQIQPTADALLRHEIVVETLCEASGALPVRFGTILPDEAAVERALDDRYEVLRAALARLGSKVELGLTVLWDSRAIPEDLGDIGDEGVAAPGAEHGENQSPGRRYLLARREAYRREQVMQKMAQTVTSDLDHHLRPYIRESQYRVDTAPGLAIRAAFLVDRGALAQARTALSACRSLYPALRFLITGPWPPYSFAGPPPPGVEGARGSPRPAQTSLSLTGFA